MGVALSAYDNIEFTLATGQTNYDVRATVSGAFSAVKVARRIEIRTNTTITVRFNSTSNSAITITAMDSPHKIEWMEITNIFITNASGETASIKILTTE